MIGESIDILLLLNNLEELKPDISRGDNVSFEVSYLREAFEKDWEISSSNDSHLAQLLQQEAGKSEFTSQLQFDVTPLEKSEAVLDILEFKRFDVLIWDNFIPEPENLEIISQINSQTPHLAIIVTGEWNDEQTVMQILQLGAQDYLHHSELTTQEFLRRMLRAIGRQQKLDLQAKPNPIPELILNETYKPVKNKLVKNKQVTSEEVVTEDITNQQAINQQAVNQQAINQQAINQQTINQQTINRQTINQQAINQQTINQQTINQQAINQQAINQQTINQQAEWYKLSNITFEGLLILEDKTIINANHILASMVGYKVEELIGKNCFELVAQESRNSFWNYILSSYEIPCEIIVIAKDRSKFSAEVQAKIIDESQQNLRLVVIRDITQRKLTEAALQKRENCLRKQSRTLVQLARSKNLRQKSNLNGALKEITEAAARTLEVERVSIWLYNQGRYNLECIDLYELSKQYHSSGQILAQKNYPAYFQALATERTINVRDAFKDPKTVELTASYLEVYGVVSMLHAPIWLWGSLVGVVFHEQVNEIRHWTLEEENFAASIADFVSLTIEASDRATTEKALRRSEEKLRAIFERSSIGIGLIDMSTRIVDTNPALCLMLGYSHDQMYGKRFTDYISPDELKNDLELYQQLVAGICDRFEMERRFVRRDGRIVWTYLSVSLLPRTDGESKLFLAIIEDITERKHTELKLRQSKEAAEAGSRAKSEFLATMSHELRTPLNAIMGLSQLLVQNIVGELNDKQKEYVNCIYTSGEHLLALINDILDLSKVEAGREELLLSPLVIKDLCQVVISTVSDRAREKDLELTAQIDDRAKICIADERRLKQMLLNLLTNAIKFTPKGKVSLIVKKVEQGINFTVDDTGIGIDPSQFKSLFEPFQQLDSRLNRQYEGTGLGLALTRKLAQLHGGDITLKSELGQGSSFTLFLPDRESEDEWGMELQTDSENDDTASISTPPLLNARTKRIALVEDEVHTANLLQDYLQTFGYRVEIFENAEDFLTQIRNYLPDLMLLSVELNGNSNGWDLLLQMRQQKNLQDLPVIMMTPMGTAKEYPKNLQNDQSKMKILEEAGAIDYLSKPIRTLQLESILMHYISYPNLPKG